MTTDPRLARFSKSRDTAAFRITEIPVGSVCLSAFVIITETGHPTKVLMGLMNPDAPWDHLSALDPSRVQVHSQGWMLLSSHLLFQESPRDAAGHIPREQLELPLLEFSEPQVVSEAYTPRRFPDAAKHWDIEFLFRSEIPAAEVPHPAAWVELAFVDLRRTAKSDIARSQEDVIEAAGLHFGDV